MSSNLTSMITRAPACSAICQCCWTWPSVLAANTSSLATGTKRSECRITPTLTTSTTSVSDIPNSSRGSCSVPTTRQFYVLFPVMEPSKFGISWTDFNSVLKCAVKTCLTCFKVCLKTIGSKHIQMVRQKMSWWPPGSNEVQFLLSNHSSANSCPQMSL